MINAKILEILPSYWVQAAKRKVRPRPHGTMDGARPGRGIRIQGRIKAVRNVLKHRGGQRRVGVIQRVRKLAVGVAQAWADQQQPVAAAEVAQ